MEPYNEVGPGEEIRMNHQMKLVTNLEDFKGEALEVEWSAFRERSSLLLCGKKDLMGLRILGRWRISITFLQEIISIKWARNFLTMLA